jgi:sugar/nucleoside kinase (ribokinase family)
MLGGNACNVSVGLARLGLHSAFLGEFGNDAFAHRIKNQLSEERVSYIHSITTNAPSSFAIGIQYKDERVLFVQHVERKHNFTYDHIRTNWVYLSSLGDQWKHVYRDVSSFIKRTGFRLAFNPGTRQIDAGKEGIAPVLKITDILFLNKEEGERIAYGKERKVKSIKDIKTLYYNKFCRCIHIKTCYDLIFLC